MTAPRLCLAVVLLGATPLGAVGPNVDPRLEATLEKLESFQTRHLFSSTETPARGIGASRQWIFDEMKSYSPRLEVSFDTYRIPKQGDRVTREVEVRNVMAVLPGRTARRFYVSGHYDTVARPVPARAGSASPAPSPSPSPGAAAQSASGGFDWSVGDNYGHQHTVDDTFGGGVDPEYLARNARVNAATLITLGLAPVAPVVMDERGRPLLGRDPSGYDAHLRWKPSPGATAYRIFWREAWTPDWQFERTVGNLTDVVMPGVSIDDFVFGVAAADAEGHESLVSAYVSPNRPDAPVQTLP